MIVLDTCLVSEFDQAASREWGRLCAQMDLSGHPIPAVDAQIATVYLLHGAAIVTRNEKDFANSGVQVVNPWT